MTGNARPQFLHDCFCLVPPGSSDRSEKGKAEAKLRLYCLGTSAQALLHCRSEGYEERSRAARQRFVISLCDQNMFHIRQNAQRAALRAAVGRPEARQRLVSNAYTV